MVFPLVEGGSEFYGKSCGVQTMQRPAWLAFLPGLLMPLWIPPMLQKTKGHMSYQVNLPAGKVIQYPNFCPFSGAQSPDGTVRLKWTSNSKVAPLPGGFQNSYTSAELKVPAKRSTAVLASILGASVWLSLLGGMAAGVVFVQSDTMERHAALAIVAGLALASLCRFLRFWVLRKFRIKGVWNEFLELRISSEQYAKEFAELNRLSIEAA